MYNKDGNIQAAVCTSISLFVVLYNFNIDGFLDANKVCQAFLRSLVFHFDLNKYRKKLAQKQTLSLKETKFRIQLLKCHLR